MLDLMTDKKIETIDDYIKTFPKDTQDILETLRQVIHEAAPDATEAISYGMPAFTQNGDRLIYFAAWKDHIGIYPTPSGTNAFEEELSQYKRTKGSVHLPLDQPLPSDLITRIVKFRVEESLR